MGLAIRAARLLTSSSAELLDDGVVIVEGETITNLGRWVELKDTLAGVPVKDLGDVTLMPGLFDCHVGFPLYLTNIIRLCRRDKLIMSGLTGSPPIGSYWLELHEDQFDR